LGNSQPAITIDFPEKVYLLMNNDMRNDEEAIETRFFKWLDGASGEHTLPLTERRNTNGAMPPCRPSADYLTDPDLEEIVQFEELISFDTEEVSSAHTEFDPQGSEPTPLSHQPDRLGEIPTMQNRFYELLKRRLKSEIQQAPPLFPWETELLEYDAEVPDVAIASGVPSPLWFAHLDRLHLPVAMPESVLQSLLVRCQNLVNSSVQEAAKWVRAVEELFPDRLAELDRLANVVRLSYAVGRDEQRSDLLDSQLTESIQTYETATPTQQMVLSLLAAREILGSLTLRVSAKESCTTRQWLTDAGVLTLNAQYQVAGDSTLRVRVEFPRGGSLSLTRGLAKAEAQRLDAGVLSVELFDIHPDGMYTLEIVLDGEETPFSFAIAPTV
jgi:hypothetical protein